MMSRMAHLSLVPALGDEEPPTEPAAVSMPVEPKRMLTFGDLFEDLRVHLDSGDREGLDLRLASLAVEFADTPLTHE